MDTAIQATDRDSNGRFLVKPDGAAPTFTSVSGRSAVQKRWEKFRRASNNRIVAEAASIDPTVATPADAFGLLAAKQYTTLMDSDKPAVDQLEKLGRIMAGDMQGSHRDNAAPPGTLIIDPSTLMELAAHIEAAKSHAADQARAIDVPTETVISADE